MTTCSRDITRSGRCAVSLHKSLRSPVLAVLAALTVVVSPLQAESGTSERVQPQLIGAFDVDPAAGLLSAEVCLSGPPVLQSSTFLLHRGLNVRDVRRADTGSMLEFERDSEGRGSYDAVRYKLATAAGAAGYCVRYRGAFPVFAVDAGERAITDWKGQIAFDGKTVRAADQSAFYPIPLSDNGAATPAMSFRLTVACAACSAIYVNGARPQAGPKASFESEVARPLLLYAGRLPYRSRGTVNFIGTEISDADADAINKGAAQLAQAHSSYLGLPYADQPSFLSFASVGGDRSLTRSTWQFVSWPTIAYDGRMQFGSLLQDGNLQPSSAIYLAHEMAHFFFGTLMVPRGRLQWFMLESTAEFMALKAYRAVYGEALFAQRIARYVALLDKVPPLVPLSRVTSPDQIGDDYRYRLGPLLWLALEGHVGAGPVREYLRHLVQARVDEDVDYPRLRQGLQRFGATEAALDRFESSCFVDRPAVACFGQASLLAEPAR